MAKSLEFGISHLLAELAADAFGVLRLLAAAGAIAPAFRESFADDLYHLRVGVELNLCRHYFLNLLPVSLR